VTFAPALIAPGTVVGSYVVERRLAQGETSVRYVARDSRGTGGARVVLKMAPAGTPAQAARARLLREARLLAAVLHPGIVRVHGTGEHEGRPWIATEYVEGADLKHLVADRGAMRPEVAGRHAVLAAEALAAMHQAGVVHQGLKPSSFVLTPGGQVVLVDFGVARRRADPRDSEMPPADRDVTANTAYVSPEQIEHGMADERSDVWALGCLLFEMVASAPPFGRGGPATTASILRDEPALPPDAGAVGDIISSCLRKSSFARVGSARELAALLRAALQAPRRDPPQEAEPRQSFRASARPSARPGASASARPPSTQPPRPPSVPPARPPSVPPQRPRLGSSPSSNPPRSSNSIRLAAPEGRIKGAALRAAIVWFAETYGEAAAVQAYQAASPALQAVLGPGDAAYGIMASSWYDAALVGELVEIVERVAAPDDPEEYRSRLAAAVARDNVGGVYRSLFRLVATPSLLEANAQRVWGTYVNEGAFVVRMVRPGAFEARVRGWSRHHPALCVLGQHLLEQMLRTIGYNGLVVERTQCVSNEDGQCVFEGNWLS
jgi:serine/threonine-protein kinase